MKDHIVIDSEARTNPSFGCRPSQRGIDELLDCGIILVNKPPGPTSHQLAAWARDILGLKRIGHGGTLDPFATGVLTLLCGRATKITEILLSKSKSYTAVLRFKTPVEAKDLSNLLDRLTTEIYNVPPKESAVKVQVRSRKIKSATHLDVDESKRIHVISVDCNAGTYIRTLSKDIGLLIGVGCELLELHRQGSGLFDDTMCCTMHQLMDSVFLWNEHGDEAGLSKIIAPVESVLDELPKIFVKDGAVSAVSHGAPLARPGLVSIPRDLSRGDIAVISSLKGEAVAISKILFDSQSIIEMSSGQVATLSTVLMPQGSYPQTWGKTN